MFLSSSLPLSAANLRTCVPNCLRYSSNSYMCDSFVSPPDSYEDRFGVAYGTVTWAQCLVFQALRFLFTLLEYWGIFGCDEGSTKCLLKNLHTLVGKGDFSVHHSAADIWTVQMFTCPLKGKSHSAITEFLQKSRFVSMDYSSNSFLSNI